MSATGLCPACGNELTFRVATSVVAVCPYCSSVVARGDAKLEDLGKTNDILATGSALSIGVNGKFRNKPYEIVGRTHIEHELGGSWDEWYAAFSDGTWGWIAEAQGRFSITFSADTAAAPRIASPAAAEPGARYATGRGSLVVAERGVATVVAEQGELPWRAAPNEKRAYVDLSGPGGVFATLDYGDGSGGLVHFFVGREVSLADLGLAAAAVSAPSLRRAEGSKKIACPRCQAPLELKTAQALSVGCSSCGAVSSVAENGELAFLFANTQKWSPPIPLGKKAKLDAAFLQYAKPADVAGVTGVELECVASVIRSVTFDGEKFQFTETLLHSDKLGFVWLVESDGHWSFVKNVPAASITEHSYSESVRYDGDAYKPYQDSHPCVEQVLGELYWKVSAGETSRMRDHIHPPFMLSREATANEVNWTLGIYVEKSDVERVFGVSLPEPTGVGANQPSPYRTVLRQGPLFIAASLALCALVAAVIPARTVVDEPLELAAFPVTVTTDPGRTFSLAPLRLHHDKNVVIELKSDDPGWIWVDGSLFAQSSGMLKPFTVTVNPPQPEIVRFSSLPTGDYALNLKVYRSRYLDKTNARVIVSQGKPGSGWVVEMILALGLAYLLVLIAHASFEKKRNANSTFGGDS